MKTIRYENQNQLRQAVKAAWAQPHSLEYAMLIKTRDRYEIAQSFRLFASELGARFIPLDIDGELSPEQVEILKRPGPRVILISGIETMKPQNLSTFSADLNAGGRALPVVLWVVEAKVEEQAAGEQFAAAS